MLVFGASLNCVPWVYVPEVLPLGVRAQGTAIGISSNWLWVRSERKRFICVSDMLDQNFVIVMITPTLIKKLAWKTYLIFMATNFSFIPIFYFFYPETANKR